MSNRENSKILEDIGGEAGCRQIAKDFYARVSDSPELKPLFPGNNFRCATEEFAAFLIQFLDGDQDQTQYRWWLSLRESHSRFQISEQQRAEWLRLMTETIHSLMEDFETQKALKQFFDVASAYILGDERGELEHQELNSHWGQQKALDRLIDHIVKKLDTEAIELAVQFESRPSVFVGILARMMESRREPLLEFVLSGVIRKRDLGAMRFNGRTLLHFAAGASCLSVVRQILQDGVNPDILDSGKHTPLYRAASSGIVEELVRHGASVNHCEGVTRSTALHQAARFGNLAVAEALLAAGASATATDKKGQTPLDRARNCRRPEVVAFLMSKS